MQLKPASQEFWTVALFNIFVVSTLSSGLEHFLFPMIGIAGGLFIASLVFIAELYCSKPIKWLKWQLYVIQFYLLIKKVSLDDIYINFRVQLAVENQVAKQDSLLLETVEH